MQTITIMMYDDTVLGWTMAVLVAIIVIKIVRILGGLILG